MLIDLIVGSALLLFGLYLLAWLRNPVLRKRIEAPKHVFLAQVLQHDADGTPDAKNPVESHR
ncbi:MAG: hypothetical protein ACO3PV_07850 [Pseudohongiellaceae bacterium]|jgi:hypothetical protein